MLKKKFLKRILTPFMIGILITTNITPVFAVGDDNAIDVTQKNENNEDENLKGSYKVTDVQSSDNVNIKYDENGNLVADAESKKSWFESKTEENMDKNTEYITHIRKVPEGSTIVTNVDTNIDTKTKGYTYWSKQIKLSEVPGGVYPLTPEGEVHVTTTQSEPITKIDTKDIYGTVQPDPIWQVVRHEGGYLVLDDIDGDYWVDGEDIYDWVYPEPKEVVIGQDTVVYKLERDGNRYVWVNQNDPNDKEQASSVQIADYKPIKINGQDYYVVNDIEKLKQEFPDAVGYIESRHTLQDATLNHIFTDKPRDEYMWFVYDQFGDQKYVYHTYINEIGLPDDQYGKYTVECKQAVDFTITDDYYWKEEYVIYFPSLNLVVDYYSNEYTVSERYRSGTRFDEVGKGGYTIHKGDSTEYLIQQIG